jgi:8-oxo-dGTP diphosphatase
MSTDGGPAGPAGTDGTTVRAAGVVLWRTAPGAAGCGTREGGADVEVALVHRPRYDDWSLPKGKLKRGEDYAAAAVRETREETGLDCELGAALPATYYLVAGRPKEVRYWAARARPGDFTANAEVDTLVWLPPSAARHRLTHDRDRPLIDAFLRALASR